MFTYAEVEAAPTCADPRNPLTCQAPPPLALSPASLRVLPYIVHMLLRNIHAFKRTEKLIYTSNQFLNILSYRI